ncbi:MAG: GNAT family N-acetyltransferase [Acidobacteriota bacterium]
MDRIRSVPVLEENELMFIRRHRSASMDLKFGTLYLSSESSVKNWNFIARIHAGRRDLECVERRTVDFFSDWKRTPCLKVTPASRPDGIARYLESARWNVGARLVHMVHDGPLPKRGPEEIRVRRCKNAEDIARFSDVQSRSFGVPDWRRWVEKVNLMNAPERNQIFYLAEVNGEPAGLSLLLNWKRVGGLYAVATLEAMRGRGVAAALVRLALQDSRKLGNEVTVLNTVSGGPASTVFSRLGFHAVFESLFYVKS